MFFIEHNAEQGSSVDLTPCPFKKPLRALAVQKQILQLNRPLRSRRKAR